MAGYFGIDKLFKAMRIVKEHGGLLKSAYQIYRVGDLKVGKFVGEDALGNKYYEDDKLMFGRNRWVVYHPRFGTDFDGSLITPEWFGWMHHKTDKPPTQVPPVNHGWITDHVENVTGTEKAYMPYTTTKPKVEAWVPSKKS